MLRLLALPFTIGLGVLAALLLVGGLAVLKEVEANERGEPGWTSLFEDREAEREARRDGMTVGMGLIVAGLLGLIASVALTIAALAGGRQEPAIPAPQQQQQVVVVTDGEARVVGR